jgi:hypothetical protein
MSKSTTSLLNTETNILNEVRASSIADAIRETNGKIFSVTFVKKNGELREMVARTKVHKGLNGNNPETIKARKKTLEENNMVTVFEISKEQYRTVNATSVVKLKCGDLLLEY